MSFKDHYGYCEKSKKTSDEIRCYERIFSWRSRVGWMLCFALANSLSSWRIAWSRLFLFKSSWVLLLWWVLMLSDTEREIDKWQFISLFLPCGERILGFSVLTKWSSTWPCLCKLIPTFVNFWFSWKSIVTVSDMTFRVFSWPCLFHLFDRPLFYVEDFPSEDWAF